MQRVVNHKAKIAFKLDEACLLEAQPGDRLILDRVSERGYVAYVVPRERFKADFSHIRRSTTTNGGGRFDEPVGDDADGGFRLRDADPNAL